MSDAGSNQTSKMPVVEGVLHFEGSCYPNPGPNSSCGFKLVCGSSIVEQTIQLGDGTCNTAEYHGLTHGLKAAVAAGVTLLEVYGDSQLFIKGMQRGPKKSGAPHLERLKTEAMQLCQKIPSVEFI